MTISNNTLRSPIYAGNGTTTTFNTSFTFNQNPDNTYPLAVQTINTSTGTITTLTQGTDYTVSLTLSGTQTNNTGSITTTVAPATGTNLVIYRNEEFLQGTAYPEGTTFPGSAHETALDVLTMTNQQLNYALLRAPLLPNTSSNYSLNTGFKFPDGGASNAGYIIRWNSTDGTTLEAVSPMNANLGTILTPTNGNIIVGNGTTWVSQSVATTLGGSVSLGGNLTTGGALTTSGAYSLTATLTGNTNVTFPTSGTLATTTGSTSITTLGTVTTGTWNATIISPTYGGTGINNGSNTITLGGNLTTSGAHPVTFTTTGSTNVTLPTSGTLSTTTGTVTSVSGTSNQIDVATGTTTPVISIDSGYVGQTSITTLGTITSGTWTGTALSIAYGGTGFSGATPFTANELIYASSTSALSQLTTANNSVLATNGSGVPAFTTSLPTAVQVGVNSLGSGTAASSSTFWRGDGSWATPSGSGNVTGAASSTDGETVLFSGTSGTVLKRSNSFSGISLLTSGVLSTVTSSTAGQVLTYNGSTYAFSTPTTVGTGLIYQISNGLYSN